jgi:hypothetical protein
VEGHQTAITAMLHNCNLRALESPCSDIQMIVIGGF